MRAWLPKRPTFKTASACSLARPPWPTIEAFLRSVQGFGETLNQTYTRLQQASAQYAQIMGGVNAALQSIWVGNDPSRAFAVSMVTIQQGMQNTIDAANAAARAAACRERRNKTWRGSTSSPHSRPRRRSHSCRARAATWSIAYTAAATLDNINSPDRGSSVARQRRRQRARRSQQIPSPAWRSRRPTP